MTQATTRIGLTATPFKAVTVAAGSGGDILSCTVVDKTTAGLATDGWYCDVVIDGFVDGGTYDWGLGTDNDPSSAKFVMTVTSEGYNSSGVLGTVTRTLYGVDVLRKAYPNETEKQETESGGDLTIRVVLSEFVYDDDKDGGAGTSGTNPTVTIAADWYTNNGTGGDSSGNNAATDLAVTNNSTLDYPKVIGRWDMLAGAMTADRVTSSFNMAAICFHGFGISAVRFDADGQTSSNNENETVTTTAAEEYTATGLYREHYKTAAISLTGFTDDELIDLRFRAYPVVGDADSILDTDSFTSLNDEILGWNKATIVCDKDDDSDLFASIDTGTGDDGTGVVSGTLATAEASPYATIGAAIADGANVIYLEDGTHGLGSGITRVASNEWIRILPHPTNSSKANAIAQMTADRDYNCERFSIEGCTVRKAGTTSYLDGENADNSVRFRDCTFDDNSIGQPSVGPGYRSKGCFFQNCDGDLGHSLWDLGSFSSSRVAYSFEGTVVDGASDACLAAIGCSDNPGVSHPASSNPAPDIAGSMYAFNSCTNLSGQQPLTLANSSNNLDGFAIVSNVIEAVSGASTAVVYISGDNSTSTTNNILLFQNTIIGERANIAYNDNGSTAYAQNNWFQIGNYLEEWNNKDDTFTTADGGRNGSWPVGYNVGAKCCLHEGDSGAGSFRGEFDGILVDWGGSPTFVDDESTNGGNTGNGNYRLQSGSVGLDWVLSSHRRLAFDLDGNARASDTAIGPYRGPNEGATATRSRKMTLLGVS